MSSIETLNQEIERLTRERDAFSRSLSTSNNAFFEKVKEFSIIKRIAESINTSLDERTIYKGIVDLIIDETTAENCSLWMVEKDAGQIVLVAVRGQDNAEPRYFEPSERQENSMPLGHGAAGTVALKGESLLIENAQNSPHFVPMKSETAIRSLLCLPIKTNETVFGVLNMSHPDIGGFSKENERVLQLITSQVSAGFTNLRLFEQVRKLNRDLERKVAERTDHLVRSEDRYNRAVSAGQVGIWDWKPGSRDMYVAPNLAAMLGFTPECAPSTLGGWLRCIKKESRLRFMRGMSNCLSGERPFYECEIQMADRKGESVWFFVRGAVVSDKDGISTRLSGSHTDITRRKATELQLASLQKEALVHAHAAGKAEFATTVLHNIGNVLTSLNVDSLQIRTATRNLRLDRLLMGFELIVENADDMAAFFASEKGDQLKTYMTRLGATLVKESERLISHTEEIHTKIDVMRDIIETQQSFASGNELKKQGLVCLVDEALKLQNESINRRGILLKKKYAAVRPIELPSARVIHILINLVKNGIEAMVDTPREKRCLSVELGECDSNSVFVRIGDTGVGIAPEDVCQLFTHGFTTKAEGHGFGLHYCAETTHQLGGKITVNSPGLGRGTVFTLTFPY